MTALYTYVHIRTVAFEHLYRTGAFISLLSVQLWNPFIHIVYYGTYSSDCLANNGNLERQSDGTLLYSLKLILVIMNHQNSIDSDFKQF